MTSRGPDFIVFGAQKSGTTSLYRYLTGHPRIAPAAEKQLDFFSHEAFHRGVEWHLSRFPKRGANVLSGEASPYYMFHPHAPRRILEFDPEVKLIAVLRNPVDRTYSHYQHQVRNWREPLSFEEALSAEAGRISGEEARMRRDESFYGVAHRRHSYLARSRYAEQLETWLSLFPRERMLVLESEAMFESPDSVLDEVASFLGLPPFRLGTYGKYMPGSYVEGMDPETRRRLVGYFRPHNERLYGMLGMEFSWDV
ncbi:MAG: sulfotransferase domain-containing protein [Rubrobacter sp.]|nr:sulfotransferase domain-containing protein [Rubrobacter sp.]